MKPEAQRIAIAEASGWKYNGLGTVGSLHHPTNCTCFDGKGCSIPDYLNDLNAMHEAEKALGNCKNTNPKWMAYLNVLREITPESHLFYLPHATAAQRAEAFLRTIGKWEDT